MSDKRLLVCFHVYYQEQIPYFIRKMRNIVGCDWDLAVSFSSLSAESRKLLTDFRPDALFIETENLGYDIWPFIKILKTVNLDNYDYILKLHTKNCDKSRSKINWIYLRGNSWRDMLVDALLKSPRQFTKALNMLENDKMTGMVCNGALISNIVGFRPWGLGILPKEMQRIGLGIKLRDKNMKFCAGTMFLARVSPFKFLVDAPVTAETFSDSTASHADNKMAHCYERMLSFAVLADNYRISGLWTGKVKRTKKVAHDMTAPLLTWLFSINYDCHGRKCLTVFGLKFGLKGRAKGSVRHAEAPER